MEHDAKRQQYPHMAPGNGENSYALNSKMQKETVLNILQDIHAQIDRMELPRDRSIVVADLGCGSGPNAIANVEAIIKRMQERYEAQKSMEVNRAVPSFQVYLQDVPTNDFNTLFQYLTNTAEVHDRIEHEPHPKYFAAGVPGSFYSALFPPSSVHIALSSFALHWLSKIPPSVLDRNSPAYNGGNVELCRSSPATVQAYAEQADRDIRDFLAARAKELVPGGLLILLFGVRVGSDLPRYLSSPVFNYEEEIMDQLVSEGVVEAEVRDSFNPWGYYRSEQEVKESVASFNFVFDVLTHKLLAAAPATLANDDPRVQAKNIENHVKGFQDGFMRPHFGPEAMDLFWRRLQEILCERNTHQTYLEEILLEFRVVMYVLRKKNV